MTAAARQKLLAWSVPLSVEILALARSVLLARVIGPEELGKTMLLALVLRLVEMLSDLGLERLLVQAPGGATRRLQAQLHGALVLRGLLLAVLLLALAPLLAAGSVLGFADGPGLWVYAALALVPLTRGLLHLDYRRAERRFDYRPLAIVELGASVVMIAALVGALSLGLLDHRVLVVALVAQAVAQVVLSHGVARRPWQLRFDAAGLARIWQFGAPLALNAGLMFLTLQGDRLIVARWWDWADLALYGIVAQVAFLPALIMGRGAMSVMLPALRAAAARDRVQQSFARMVRQSAWVGVGFALAFGAAAPFAIQIVYGAALRPEMALAAAFGVAAGLRIWRTPYSVLAIATARTGDPARANSWRALGLLPGLLVALVGLPLAAFAATSALGEAAALIRARLLARHSGERTDSGTDTTTTSSFSSPVRSASEVPA